MRKLIVTVYGMQYEELVQGGRDGQKARLNGNLLIAAFLLIVFFVVVLALTHVASIERILNGWLDGFFGRSNGRTIGKILALPLFGLFYLIVAATIGSNAQFTKAITNYAAFLDTQKRQSLRRVMIPFLGSLAVLLILALV